MAALRASGVLTGAAIPITGTALPSPETTEWYSFRGEADAAGHAMRERYPDRQIYLIRREVAHGWSVIAQDPEKPKPAYLTFFDFSKARYIADRIRTEHPAFVVEIKPYVKPEKKPMRRVERMDEAA